MDVHHGARAERQWPRLRRGGGRLLRYGHEGFLTEKKERDRIEATHALSTLLFCASYEGRGSLGLPPPPALSSPRAVPESRYTHASEISDMATMYAARGQ